MPARKGSADSSGSKATPDPLLGELSRLVRGEHNDPHQVLGVHKTDGHAVVRALRPDAIAMRVLVDGDAAGVVVDMRRRDEAGLFEAEIPEGASESYRL